MRTRITRLFGALALSAALVTGLTAAASAPAAAPAAKSGPTVTAFRPHHVIA